MVTHVDNAGNEEGNTRKETLALVVSHAASRILGFGGELMVLAGPFAR